MARKTKKLHQRDKFVIFTNGKMTEKNYFQALRGYRHSIFDITVKFVNADPEGLIRRAVKEKDSSNQVWVVFHKDEFPSDKITAAMIFARKSNVGVALSNAAFEVWLINHIKEYSSEKTASELLQILDSILKDEGYLAGYSKNDSDMITEVFLPRLDEAVHNADVSLQKRIAEYNLIHTHSPQHGYPYCDWNSCTTVHKLIEALKLDSRD